MTARFLAKRDSINYMTKASLAYKNPFPYVDSAMRISRACFSSAFERAQGSNEMEETRGVGEGMYEAKQQGLDMDENSTTGATKFVADTAKEGVRKATEMADTVGESAKKAMDGAWEAGEEANHKIRETIVGRKDDNNNKEDLLVDEVPKMEGPVDTVEYRNMGKSD